MSQIYGTPYKGSKSKIAPYLADYMINKHPNKHIFIDCCCGGLAMSHYILENYSSVRIIASDFEKSLYNLYKAIFSKDSKKLFDKLFSIFVNRDEFFECLEKDDAYSTAVRFCYSFGNDGRTYLYSEDIENEKELLSNLLLLNLDKCAKETENTPIIRKWYKTLDDDFKKLPYSTIKRIKFLNLWKDYISENRFELQQLERLERLEHLQHLQHLQRLEHLQHLQHLQRLELHHGDAIKLLDSLPKEILQNAIIYFDPPYINTNKYKITDYEFNERLRIWSIEHKDICPVYISEYTQYEGLSLVNYENKQSLLCATNNRMIKKELLMYNDYESEPTLFDLLGGANL